MTTVQAAGPTVSVTSPVANSTQSGTITIQASAGTGTLGVQFKINGVNLGTEDTTAPYTSNWDTKFAPKSSGGSSDTINIDYNITAVARGTGGSTTSTPVKVKLYNTTPISGTTIVVGDSVSQQAFDPNADGTFTYTANAPTPESYRRVFAHMGWTVSDVQTTTSNYAIFRWPQKFVVAMGLNEAGTMFGGDGWTSADLDRFRTLINTSLSGTCTVLVLPGHGAGADAAWAAEIDEARAALVQLATERPRTYTVDWQPVIDQHPEYVDEDGIHLLTPYTTPAEDLAAASQDKMNPVDPVAADARQNFYWNAAAQCDAPSATFQTPANNAKVEGTVSLAVNTIGAPSVQFKVDGQDIGSPVTGTPYQLNWDTTTMPNGTATTNGTHTITAVSTNFTGSSTTSITVNVQNPPLPGTVELVGDSITFQSFWYHGFLPTAPDDAHRDIYAWLGWQVRDVQAHVTEKAAQRWPETLIVALGTNDSSVLTEWGQDGWTPADLQRFRTLINTVHPSTKVVLVLPGYGAGVNPNHATQMDLAKQDLTALATERPHTIVVSWQALIDADPTIMDTDGIHLAWETYNNPDGTPALNPDGTPARRVTKHAADTRQQLYWDAWQLALQN